MAQALDIWMNGACVGQWERPKGVADRLVYDPQWIASAAGRPLSLSLPFSAAHGGRGENMVLRGERVT